MTKSFGRRTDVVLNMLPQGITDKIHQAGTISFARLMDLALYSEHGYYSERVQIGRKGADFFTASQSPLFGMTLAAAIETKWQEWGEPPELQVVEVGAGQGELAETILSELTASSRINHVSYCILERSAKLRQVQHERLEQAALIGPAKVIWEDPVKDIPTIIIANEVLDALPVEVVKKTHRGWELLSAGLNASNGLTWHWNEADRNAAALANEFINCPEGTVAEICLFYESTMAQVMDNYSAPVQALWFDYGIFKEEWEAGVRPEGTLRAYLNHEIVDPYTHLFEADITADANWTHAEAVSRKFGFSTEVITQGNFLFRHDIMKRAVELQQSEPTLLAGSRWTQQLKQLALPGGMGDRFSVLICERSVAR
ncbi:SAM-dependent methyltransferase [Alicyclobacillus sp. SO9]|uniref:SAM-dependent methyltransferase n=1 Tax=Alicyclobacillus sp. SO9 TaxID=2665646 RepID=UPI0018E79EC7|nr:SAM-dependent methyltransferase [Alicyclobacillus sp. SO9]QQE80687.1 SAM-dependent methyltransferase [Alicyclobacillus sp. SO9]